MPKLPDDMSATAIKKRAQISEATKTKPVSPADIPPPKIRIAKKR